MSFLLRIPGKSHQWGINDRKPELDYSKFSERVQYFQADGDELSYIMLRFRNLPITHGGMCKWRGELAQFIYDNL